MSSTGQPPIHGVTKNTHYWSFDPGKTTGYAHFDAEGKLLNLGSVIGLDSLTDYLEDIPDENIPRTIIVENYMVDPNIPQGGLEVTASEAIGRISHYARIRRIPVVRQSRLIKRDAYRRAGINPPKDKKLEHQYDAYVHGNWWLCEEKIIDRTPDLLRKLKRNDNAGRW